MDHFLSDAKRLVQRLQHHDNAVDILIGEATNLQNKLIAMRQYKDEVNKMNQAANHRPRSTLILGSQLENQRIQNLEQENRELSISLAEHQSALELIMNKYREQVLVMMKTNGASRSLQLAGSQPSETELKMSEQIAEMAFVMRQSASIDESVAAKEIETMRSLQIENDNLRQLLQISGQNLNKLDINNQPENHSGASSGSMNTSPVAETVCNKDSGIYDEDFSPNFNVLRKGRKNRTPLNSKHIGNLESLFKHPEIDNKPVENHILPEPQYDNPADDTPYQIYTVEALVENKTSDESGESQVNGETHSVDEGETPDEVSQPSYFHVDEVNNEFKRMVTENENESSQDETDDALQFLDDMLEFSENDELSEIETTEHGDGDIGDTDVASIKENINKDTSLEGSLQYDNNDEENLTENNELDFLDDLNQDLENQFLLNSGDVDLTLQSDTESEMTVTEDDALAMFDSVLEDEMEMEDHGERNNEESREK